MVSFKLETDRDILLQKAQAAISKYQMNLVVANELHSRYDRVDLVVAGADAPHTILRPETSELEVPLVAALAKAHDQFRSHA